VRKNDTTGWRVSDMRGSRGASSPMGRPRREGGSLSTPRAVRLGAWGTHAQWRVVTHNGMGQNARHSEAGGPQAGGTSAEVSRMLPPAKTPEKMHARTTLI